MAQGDPILGEWPNLMHSWMKGSGFLTSEPRVAVRGLVKVDGEPLPRGHVLFTPVDQIGAPQGVGRVFNTGPVRGEFALREKDGLVPGRYKVEVRQDATRWESNARNPYLQKLGPKLRAGTITPEERQEWIDATRKRDLSPSIEGQRIYRKKSPSDATEMMIEIKPGSENRIDLEIVTK